MKNVNVSSGEHNGGGMAGTWYDNDGRSKLFIFAVLVGRGRVFARRPSNDGKKKKRRKKSYHYIHPRAGIQILGVCMYAQQQEWQNTDTSPATTPYNTLHYITHTLSNNNIHYITLHYITQHHYTTLQPNETLTHLRLIPLVLHLLVLVLPPAAP